MDHSLPRAPRSRRYVLNQPLTFVLGTECCCSHRRSTLDAQSKIYLSNRTDCISDAMRKTNIKPDKAIRLTPCPMIRSSLLSSQRGDTLTVSGGLKSSLRTPDAEPNPVPKRAQTEIRCPSSENAHARLHYVYSPPGSMLPLSSLGLGEYSTMQTQCQIFSSYSERQVLKAAM
jgi:hypothetical protein